MKKTVVTMNGVDGACKTITTRQGRLSWENYLGRLEHGGWDSMMTCIIEIEDENDDREQEA